MKGGAHPASFLAKGMPSKPQVSDRCPALRELPPEPIAQAKDRTIATITRIMLTLADRHFPCLPSRLPRTPQRLCFRRGDGFPP